MCSGDVLTVRIPELTSHTSPANGDKLPIWVEATNKTRNITLQSLREFLEIGEAGTYGPVQNGQFLLYVVPADKEGDDFVTITGIAGKNFALRRDGFPLRPQNPDPLDPDPDAEYEILGSGGFKLLTTTLVEGQRYELEVYELGTGSGAGPSTSGDSGPGFIKGAVTVNTNTVVSVNDLNKLLQVRGGSNTLTITLPDVSLCPANSFVPIECLVNNTKQHTVNTTGGQNIYINNQSRTNLYLGVGDVVWFYRTEDGWFVIVQKGNQVNLAMPKAAYKVGLNQRLCNGDELLRASYPRLWEEVKTIGSALIDEATWQTASATLSGVAIERPYRGCFSTGDGSTTFRIPDLMNTALRGLKNDGGADTERVANIPGSFQDDRFKDHYHETGTETTPGPGNIFRRAASAIRRAWSGTTDAISSSSSTGNANAGAGTETRMQNIGILWVIDY